MTDKLIELLSGFGYPVLEQGSMGKDEDYPNSFFTFFNIDTPDSAFYDNKATKFEWIFNLCFYSNDFNLAYSKFEEATKLLKENGWIIRNSKGYAAPSDVDTHLGRQTRITYEEREENL